MKLNKKTLALAVLTLGSAIGAVSAQAATKTQCDNIAAPPGYLLVQERIINSKCPSGYQAKFETPRNGLNILLSPQLVGLPGKPYRVEKVNGAPTAQTFQIYEVVDNRLYCDLQPAPYNFVSLPATASEGNCGVVNGLISKRIRMHEVFTAAIDVPSSGSAARLKVNLNSKLQTSSFNYVVRTTATLNGVPTTVIKPSFTGNGSLLLRDVAPTLVSQAEQGASFSFEIEVFDTVASKSKKTVTATGAQLVGN